jgi:hypothetical protein
VVASWLVARQKALVVTTSTAANRRSAAVGFSPRAVFAPTFTTIWISIFFLATVLTLVKWDSVSRGPTGHEAITVLRVVEREVAQAKWEHARTHGAILSSADAVLEQAWTDLEEKRYQDAIVTAQRAEKMIESLIRKN